MTHIYNASVSLNTTNVEHALTNEKNPDTIFHTHHFVCSNGSLAIISYSTRLTLHTLSNRKRKTNPKSGIRSKTRTHKLQQQQNEKMNKKKKKTITCHPTNQLIVHFISPRNSLFVCIT